MGTHSFYSGGIVLCFKYLKSPEQKGEPVMSAMNRTAEYGYFYFSFTYFGKAFSWFG